MWVCAMRVYIHVLVTKFMVMSERERSEIAENVIASSKSVEKTQRQASKHVVTSYDRNKCKNAPLFFFLLNI